ncbi:G-protein coupled receptor 4-like [Embiotoca jacksoni]|uniref:G-protein coupled receptor 4-like n=1 Tax=Embiotoca jacksoni TaxID=100190 RepID=UPI0037048D3B
MDNSSDDIYFWNDTFYYDYNDYYDYEYYTIFQKFNIYGLTNDLPAFSYVIAWTVICVGCPLTFLAIYALGSLVRNDHVAPVYVINLLMSDFIQIFCNGIFLAKPSNLVLILVTSLIHYLGVMASVAFMVCVALERYLVIAWPLWYRFRRSIMQSVLVSVTVWALCFIHFLVTLLNSDLLYRCISSLVFFLLPFPLLLFSLAGTLKALSAAISVSVKEKRRIVGTLVVVLFLPTVLFLLHVLRTPRDLFFILEHANKLALSFLQFSPLVNLVLYVFMKKGVADKLLACLRCCITAKKDENVKVRTDTKRNTEDVSSV